MHITWLGHATVYLVTNGGTRILVDAWIDNNPACPPEWHNNIRTLGIDVILLTHGHIDHSLDVAPLYRDTGARVVCQYDVIEWLTYQDVAPESIEGMNKGGTIRIGDTRITMTTAQHSSNWPTAAGRRVLGTEVGYMLRVDNDVTVYAAGDTTVMADMAILADLYAPDIAILPIGDRYTMGPYEAAYALKLLRAAHVLPIHYQTFPDLTGTPALLADEIAARGVTCSIIPAQVGQPYVIGAV
jgi:L-ascorbate metabolism protein UlaG (beta-lactamase superfamily)